VKPAAFAEAVLVACLGLSVGIRPALAQSGGEVAARPTSLLTVAQLQEDFDVLRRAIEEAHGGLDRFTPTTELDRRFDNHRARLNHPINTLSFAGVVAEAIAELRDGHARLEWDSLTNAALADARVLPLRVQFEGERLIILFNDAPGDSTLRPGMEVLRINGRAISELIRVLLPKVSGDGFIETGRRVRLARTFPQLVWLFVVQSDRYTVTARDDAGRSVTAVLPGVRERDRLATTNPVNTLLAENIARLDAPPGNIALQFYGDHAIARLRIRGFDGSRFAATLDSAFGVVRESTTRTLILDLRGNGGGVDEYGALLVSYFMQEPFRYFDHIQVKTIAPSFATWLPRTFEKLRAGTVPYPSGGFRVTPALHPGVGEQRPASQPFLGKLIVLIDGGTFSTAADVAAQLRSRGRATFIGEETGGTYEGNTSGLNALIVLPHSRLRLKIMMYGYWNAVRPPERPGRGTLPDEILSARVADLLRGSDRTLERALAIAR
jgi:peptidase S41-like protein